jgi:predicted dienelactone hydrolase
MHLAYFAVLGVAFTLTSGALGQSVPATVGFQYAKVADQDGIPIDLAIWYPSTAEPAAHRLGPVLQTVSLKGAVVGRKLPLIVMSHGSGGAPWNNYDTAWALAAAGFAVVAPTHPGDNQTNRSRAAMVLERPEHVTLAVDFMVTLWPASRRIDDHRVGFFGFSAGGFTGLVVTGGVPDFRRLADHCRAHPLEVGCVVAKPLLDDKRVMDLPSTRHLQDERIKAAVLAVPTLGFAFTPDRLAAVKVPVQLWRAGKDDVAPHPWHADTVRQALPMAPDYRVVNDAGHFDFIAPCTPEAVATAAFLCQETPGFDRAAFRERFNDEVVAFFKRELRVGAP